MLLRPLLLTLFTAAPALAQVPLVVADLPVTQSLAAQVMGELGTPGLILERGADPHHAQLRPSQARALAGADLVIWIGEGMSPWLEGPMQTLPTGRVLELATVEGLRLRAYGEAGHDDHDDDHHDDHGDDDHGHDHDHHDHAHDDHDDHAHDHDHDNHDDHGHDAHGHDDHGHAHDDHAHAHDHDHTGTDPHLWLDPRNAAQWLQAIGAELSALDPANAAQYQANVAAAVADLVTLTDELAAILAPVQGQGLVMFHDAYGYFAGAFGLNIVATVTDGDATTPGAARLSALRAQLAEAGALCLFPEANHSDAFARVVSEGTALRLGAPLDPAGVTLEPGADLYATLMRGLAQGIADCAAQ